MHNSYAIYLSLALSLSLNVALGAAAGYWLYMRGGLSRFSIKAVKGVDQREAKNVRRELYRDIDFSKRKTRPIVMFGDSLTAGGLWSEWYGPSVLNRAIGGETTADGLARVPDVSKLRPSKVFVLFGTNDYEVFSPEETVRNVRSIVEALRFQSPTSELYVESLLPTVTRTREGWVSQVNASLKRMADAEHVHWVDLYSYFLDGGLIDESLTIDGIHLSARGYRVWRKVMDPFIFTEDAAAPDRLRGEAVEAEGQPGLGAALTLSS